MDATAVCGLRDLFNGLVYIIDETAATFPIGAGDVGGVFSSELGAGDDVKKFGGLELGTGEDGRGDGRTGSSCEYSIEQSLRPGEPGGRGDMEPGEVTDTGSVESNEFDCSFEILSAGGGA